MKKRIKIFEEGVKLLEAHLGHKIQYMQGGKIYSGIALRISVNKTDYIVKIYLDEKEGKFSKVIFGNQVWDCECKE